MNCEPVQVGERAGELGGDGQIHFILAEAFVCSPVLSDTRLLLLLHSPLGEPMKGPQGSNTH